MHATKETFGISIVALLIALLGVATIQFSSSDEGRRWLQSRFEDPRKLAIHLAIALPLSLLASAALYSVWFNNPEAIADSYKTYTNYFGRATGPTGHEKPWRTTSTAVLQADGRRLYLVGGANAGARGCRHRRGIRLARAPAGDPSPSAGFGALHHSLVRDLLADPLQDTLVDHGRTHGAAMLGRLRLRCTAPIARNLPIRSASGSR